MILLDLFNFILLILNTKLKDAIIQSHTIIKTVLFVKPVKPQQIALSKSKCAWRMRSTMHTCI